MKCAKEFIIVKEMAIAKRDAEERQKDLEAMAVYHQRCADTITFCDTFVDEKLTERAEACEPILIKIKGYFQIDRLKNEYFVPYDNIVFLSVGTLKEYLEQHCLVCEFNKESFSYKRGRSTTCGTHDVLTIYAPKEPECVK